MARGYPDYFGFSIFPNFGIAQLDTPGGGITANLGTRTLISLTSKGKIYGGSIHYSGMGNVQTSVQLTVTVDGTALRVQTAWTDYEFGYNGLDAQFANVTALWRTATQEFVTWCFTRDYTWVDTLVVSIYNVSGANITSDADMLWAKVV